MPRYEYRCTGCARHIEVQQSFTDAPLEKCEVCGEKLRRIFSPVGVLFKGSGFYSTDARSGKRKADKLAANGEKPPEKEKTKESTKKVDANASSNQGSSREGSSGEGSSRGRSAGQGSSGEGSAPKGSSERGSAPAPKSGSGDKPA